jgi:hypothetical protein
MEWTANIRMFAKKYRGSGETDSRPDDFLEAGDWFFDTTIEKPVFYDGMTWVYWLSPAADSANSTVSVDSANASSVSGTPTTAGVGFLSDTEFNAAITAIGTIRTLANELKGDVNQLVADLNDLKTKLRTAGLIA